MSSVTAEVILRSTSGGLGGPPSAGNAAPTPAKLPPFDMLIKAFPPTRLTAERGSWAQRLFLLAWLPFGTMVLLPLRTCALFATLALHMMDLADIWLVMPRVTCWSSKVRYVDESAVSNEQGKESGAGEQVERSSFKWASGHGPSHSLAKLFKSPGKTVLAVEHHMSYMEGLMLRGVMKDAFAGAYTLVGRGSAQDALVNKMFDSRVISLFPGDKLSDGIERWRNRSLADPAPLTVFPAGTTSQPGTVVTMLPRLFELIEGDEEVRPVCVDFNTPLPAVNPRGLGCANASDMAWYAITPWLEVTFTVLPPVPRELMDKVAAANAIGGELGKEKSRLAATECASYCERVIAANSVEPKERIPVNLYHKRAWERLAVAADYPQFKRIETAMMQSFQRSTQAPLYKWAATALHFATQEPVLIAMGALLLFSGLEPTVLFGPLGRALSLNMCLMHVLKQIFRVPRPAWAKGAHLPNRPQLMSPPLASHEWSMPSGHAGFMGCLYGGVAALCAAGGLQHCPETGPNLPAWAHVAFVVGTVMAAAARVWLSLHWPSDVVVGAGFGAAVGFIYVKSGDLLFTSLPLSSQIHCVLVLSAAFAAFCQFNSRPTALEAASFPLWSTKALHAVNPCNVKPWLLALGIYMGIWLAAPIGEWMQPGRLGGELSIRAGVQGMFVSGVAAVLLLYVPSRLLASWKLRAATSLATAARAARVPGSCPVEASAARHVRILEMASHGAMLAGTVGLLQVVLFASTPALA